MNEEEVSSSYVDIWEKDLEMISKLREKEPPDILKRRQLEIIGASVKQLKRIAVAGRKLEWHSFWRRQKRGGSPLVC